MSEEGSLGRRRTTRWLWVGMLCLGVVLAASCSDSNQDPVAEQTEPAEIPTQSAEPDAPDDESAAATDTPPAKLVSVKNRPVSVPTEGYTASKSCQECHKDEYHSWHASYHRTMTQVVNEETAPEAIRDNTVTVAGKVYQFEERAGRFFVTFRDPLSRDEIRRREIVMMTGSHHMHVFWYGSDAQGTPGQLEIVYLKEQQRWIPRLSSFLQPPDLPEGLELGTWNRTCSRCHSTHPRERYDQATGEWDTHVVEFGIACEACHGQGDEHAKLYSSDRPQELVGDAELVDKIVNPETVSQQVSADLCGQCHSVFMPDYDALSQEEYFLEGNPFEPGQQLSDSGFNQIIRASAEHRDSASFQKWSQMEEVGGSFWSDGMPRVAGREYNGLIESPCYEAGQLTCLSCHTMHPGEDQALEEWRDDQLKPGMRGDQACLQCHEDYADRIEAHTHHAAESSGSRCMNCHMPHTTYGLLKTIRSHQISSPSIKESSTTDRPNACSLCHLDRSFSWVAGHLSDWYDQPALAANEDAKSTPVSTSVIHLLSGDAAQRAVQAAAFGWEPAREASGTDWMEPYLLFGVNDPYDAVRIIAARSLKSLPDKKSADIDPLASPQQRMSVFNSAVGEIDRQSGLKPRPEVLINDEGAFDFQLMKALLDRRNHRPIRLRE